MFQRYIISNNAPNIIQILMLSTYVFFEGMDSIFNEKLLDRIYMIIRILLLRLSGRKP